MKQILLSILLPLLVFLFIPTAVLAQADLPKIDKASQSVCVFQKTAGVTINKITQLVPKSTYSWYFANFTRVPRDAFTTKTETSKAFTIPAVDIKGTDFPEGIYTFCIDYGNTSLGSFAARCNGGSNTLTIKLTNGPPTGDISCNQVFPTPTPAGAKSSTVSACSYDDCNGQDCRQKIDKSSYAELTSQMCIISSKLGEPLKCACGAVPPPPKPPCENSALDPKTSMCTKIHTAIGDIETTPVGFVKVLFGIFLSLAGGIAVILLIISGYQIMTSEGNPEKIQGARDTITSAIIGLTFLIFSLAILEIIGVNILHIPGLGK